MEEDTKSVFSLKKVVSIFALVVFGVSLGVIIAFVKNPEKLTFIDKNSGEEILSEQRQKEQEMFGDTVVSRKIHETKVSQIYFPEEGLGWGKRVTNTYVYQVTLFDGKEVVIKSALYEKCKLGMRYSLCSST